MKPTMTRRQFFRWTGAGMLGAAWQGSPLREWLDTGSLARVTRQQVNVYAKADMQSEVVGKKFRDEILHVYYPVTTDRGINRLWFRTWGGYVHSGHLQIVSVRANPIDEVIPDGGCPVEVTVPYSQSMRYRQFQGWEPIYRLYYGSVHWIAGLVDGPDGSPWYQIVDSYQRAYYAPAAHFRRVTSGDISPIARDVPPEDKRIVVSIGQQRLTAFEGDRAVLDTLISSGIPQVGDVPPGEVPTDTPLGNYRITVKAFFRHMGGTQMTPDLTYGAYPGVPWVGFFHHDGYSFHGTYWHHNFGIRMSHGCVNMKTEEALWLFRWSDPVITLAEREVHGVGTRVQIME